MQLHRGIFCGMMGKKGGKAMTYTAKLVDRAKERLLYWEREVKLDNQMGLTDINKAAENFYRGLLNIILDAELVNMNLMKMDFPAVDLAEKDGGLCVQVTSTEDRDKINHTLTKFFERDLQRVYSRLIVVIIGTKPKYSKTPFPTKDGFALDRDGDIWDTAGLLQQIEGLDDGKLKRVDEYLTRELGEGKRPALRLPIGESLGVDGFVGREAELAEMAQAIADGVKPVVLWGLGGMGKTELACQFGRKYTAGRVFFARFRESFYGTVADSIALGIPGVAERPMDGAQRYCLAMEQLRLCSQKDVLIVDNADGGSRFEELKDEAYRALCALPLRLIVTTRHKVNRAIEVRRLENGELYRIFENHEATVTREQMDALIAAAEGHTLTVDLMARTLAQSWGTVKPEDILRALDEGNLAQKQFPAVYSDHDPREARRQERIYARLAALFDLSAIGEAGRTVLGCATLLPEGGMEESLFYLALPEALREELDSLEKRGWLNREKGVLRIHPVVRLVCRTELKPTEENCKAFLRGIDNQYDRKQYDHEKFRQMAEVFETASNLLEDKTGVWASLAGYLWNQVAETQRALACNLRSVQICEQHQPDSNHLSIGYNNVCVTYYALGDHKQALKYQLKALEIWERVLPPEHPDLATSYNNVGVTYDELGDHNQALAYKLKALAICERVLPPEHPDLAIGYNSTGYTYGALGEHKQALEYQLKAIGICERVLPPEHPDLAASYNNVSATYYGLGEHKQALEYQLKALGIRERVLPPEHPDLALSYNNVGYTYGELGDHEKELEYKLKALGIWERVLPGNHPSLALSLNNIAWTYYALGQIGEAATHMRRAADIINRSTLPENHPDRVNVNKWADRLEAEARKPKRRGWLARLFGK